MSLYSRLELLDVFGSSLTESGLSLAVPLFSLFRSGVYLVYRSAMTKAEEY